ncbi:MAG: P-II family nitrogen regulator [Gemmatimonadetes bacterium]|nr:P-II family nitrogen regulator [Gemmatimonadota bacterium]
MKLIRAIIRPDKLSDVMKALYQAEVQGITVYHGQGHGGETSAVATYRGTTVKMELTEKVILDIGVSDTFKEPVIQAILNSARTGDVGDGKIFVIPVEEVHRIRTGERDKAAVTPVTEAARSIYNSNPATHRMER